MIFLNQSDIHINILIGNKRQIVGNRRGLKGVINKKLVERREERLLIAKKF
jgi:hypothetical protein